MHDRLAARARPAAIARAAASRASGRQRRTRPSSTTSAPLWTTSGSPAAELVGDAARRRVAAARDQHDADAAARARVDRLARARRERLVAAQQRAVDVEGDEPDARARHAALLARPHLDPLDHVARPDPVDDVHAATTWPKSV